MFENLSELTKTTQKQKIALNALMVCGCVNWVEYNDDGSITVQWEDGEFGLPNNYTITREGETLLRNKKRRNVMTPSEFLRLQNERKDNFF